MEHDACWLPSDWEFAFDTLLVHARFCETGSYARELRARQAIMAKTADARRNQRIVYTAPKKVAAVTPKRPDMDCRSL